jgi:hypothetical protein
MNCELIRIELKINYEAWMNIHINELHSSCESDVCNRFETLIIFSFNIGLQFSNEVVKDLILHLVIKHRFTIMYKPNINGLVETVNETFCSILTKVAKIHENVCDF